MINITNNGLNKEQYNEAKDYLEKQTLSIFSYFNNDPFQINIKIINHKKEFDELYGENIDWVVAFYDSENNSINALNYNNYNESSHINDSFEDYKKTLLHECVHLIHYQYCNGNYPETPILEGIAELLSEQNYKDVDISGLTYDDFINNTPDLKKIGMYSCYRQLVKELKEYLPENIFKDLIANKIDNREIIEDYLNIKRTL